MLSNNILYDTIKKFQNDEILSNIEEQNIDINEIFSYSALPINIAIRFDNLDALKILISKGASVTLVDSDGLSPIENAAWCNNAKAISILLKENISVLQMENALKISIAKGNTNAAAELIKEGIEINKSSLNRLLYISALRGENENISIFYLNGANLNYKKDGVNSLTAAIRNKNSTTVKTLIELGGEDVGVESSIQNIDKEEWFSHIYNNEIDMVRHLIAKGGGLITQYKNDEKYTAIEIAAINNDVELFKALLPFYSNEILFKIKDSGITNQILSLIG